MEEKMESEYQDELRDKEEKFNNQKKEIIENLRDIERQNPDMSTDINLQLANIFPDGSLDTAYKGYFGEQARRFGMNSRVQVMTQLHRVY